MTPTATALAAAESIIMRIGETIHRLYCLECSRAFLLTLEPSGPDKRRPDQPTQATVQYCPFCGGIYVEA